MDTTDKFVLFSIVLTIFLLFSVLIFHHKKEELNSQTVIEMAKLGYCQKIKNNIPVWEKCEEEKK